MVRGQFETRKGDPSAGASHGTPGQAGQATEPFGKEKQSNQPLQAQNQKLTEEDTEKN